MKVFVAGATGAIGRLLVPRSRTRLMANRSRRPWAAIRHLEEAVLGARWTEGIVLRYGAFYGPGTDAIAYPASPL